MDSFASQPRVYDDGQENLVPIPDEIQQYGFRPPVRAKDGQLIKGDKMIANHLNFILNDIYKKMIDKVQVVDSGGNNSAGWRKFSDGSIDAWGKGKLVGGEVTIDLPMTFPQAPTDIVATVSGANFGVNIDVIDVVVAVSATTTSMFFVGRFVPVAGGAGGKSGASFNWRASYHPTAAA